MHMAFAEVTDRVLLDVLLDGELGDDRESDVLLCGQHIHLCLVGSALTALHLGQRRHAEQPELQPGAPLLAGGTDVEGRARGGRHPGGDDVVGGEALWWEGWVWTERQRGREAARQRDRETERQRDRETVSLETERQRDR